MGLSEQCQNSTSIQNTTFSGIVANECYENNIQKHTLGIQSNTFHET